MTAPRAAGAEGAPLRPAEAPREPVGRRMFSVERIAVGSGRIRCEVRLAPGAPRLTSPALMERVLARFPDLASHACVNEAGSSFGDAMLRTPIPHLFEHLVIDLQARDAADGAAVFVGTTEWLDKERGSALVEVSFENDLAALRAIKEAAAFLDAELAGS